MKNKEEHYLDVMDRDGWMNHETIAS